MAMAKSFSKTYQRIYHVIGVREREHFGENFGPIKYARLYKWNIEKNSATWIFVENIKAKCIYGELENLFF